MLFGYIYYPFRFCIFIIIFGGRVRVRLISATASWARNNKKKKMCVRVSVSERASECERAHDYLLSFVIKFIGRAYLARHM